MIDELRLVANTVKHAGGDSLEKLKLRNPSLFKDPLNPLADAEPPGWQFVLAIRPLVGEGLRLTTDHFNSYKSAIDMFWDELTTALLPVFCPDAKSPPPA